MLSGGLNFDLTHLTMLQYLANHKVHPGLILLPIFKNRWTSQMLTFFRKYPRKGILKILRRKRWNYMYIINTFREKGGNGQWRSAITNLFFIFFFWALKRITFRCAIFSFLLISSNVVAVCILGSSNVFGAMWHVTMCLVSLGNDC